MGDQLMAKNTTARLAQARPWAIQELLQARPLTPAPKMPNALTKTNLSAIWISNPFEGSQPSLLKSTPQDLSSMLAEFEADCVVEQRPASAKRPILAPLDEVGSSHARNHSAVEQRPASAKRPILAPLDEADSLHAPDHSAVVQRPANPKSLSKWREKTGKRLRRQTAPSRLQHVEEEISPRYLACGMFSSEFVAGRQMVSGELSQMFGREPARSLQDLADECLLEQDLSDAATKVSKSPICEQLRHAKMAMQSRYSLNGMPTGAIDAGLQFLSHLHDSPRSIRVRRRSMRKKFSSSPAA